VNNLESEKSDTSRMNNIVLSKRVVLDRGKEKKGFFLSEKTVDVTATSNFGKEHDIANVDCIIAGLRAALKNSTIISTGAFWESVGRDKETLNLTSLFDERYSHIARMLELDFVVVAYHQRFDMESAFMEYYVEGIIVNNDREVAATLTVDLKDRRVIDATKVDGQYWRGAGHVLFVIPFAIITYPEEKPCQMAGKRAAEAISRSLTTNKISRIAVVAAETNPYFILSVPTHVSGKTLKLNKEIETYCKNADSGHTDAQKHIGDLYYLGTHGIKRDLILAYVWYSLAAAGENIEATRQLHPLIDELSPSQTDEAVRQLLDWEPGQCERDLTEAISQ
jgi:hypothetical protein